ncbi:class II fructose-bisphosphate aldolase [Paenibacillus rigui]|uniref:Fructose-bisphosphate aldolase n=1 Tax=Paenibacillus rigui TaxID=554312 RepID=A0A229UHB3_9BACL|nr:class II fructose-bisphosphate aldolase [Paenibacillus rigui]OXM82349.1 fructose-bisphosphate aldolase [Paenibacillus rigui]
MMVNTKEILAAAQLGGYAVAAFNVYNQETARAAIRAAESERQPVIIALGERYFPTVDVEGFAAMVQAMAAKAAIQVALHLDHAYERASIERAIACGFSSVMFDGSKYELEQNIRHTQAIVALAHEAGVAVEAEIGSMARGAFSDEEEGSGLLTSPAEAATFVAETGVDFLAAAIGTVHGMYEGEPNIDLGLLEQIRAVTQVPLVLHGGSGTPDATLIETIRRGICKINVNTEISLAATGFLQHYAPAHPKAHLSVVMAELENTLTPVMSRFVSLFANRA